MTGNGPALRGLMLPALILAVGLDLAGCERVFRNMYDQPKLKTNATSPLFDDGEASRPPPVGAVAAAVGEAAANASGRRGGEAVTALDAADAAPALPPGDSARLDRGRERYSIYCVPCHSSVGDGDGMIVRRGFPAPQSFAVARLRAASDRHLYDVIGNGWGVMLPFAERIDAGDRWAIVAYVRHLQQDVLPAAAASGVASDPAGTKH